MQICVSNRPEHCKIKLMNLRRIGHFLSALLNTNQTNKWILLLLQMFVTHHSNIRHSKVLQLSFACLTVLLQDLKKKK